MKLLFSPTSSLNPVTVLPASVFKKTKVVFSPESVFSAFFIKMCFFPDDMKKVNFALYSGEYTSQICQGQASCALDLPSCRCTEMGQMSLEGSY